MKLLAFLAFVLLGILSLRGIRWAYFTFVLMSLLYFPVSVGFRFNPQPCELTPSVQLAIHSLTNYAHIVMFALFFVMTSAQLRMSNWSAYGWAAIATIGMGALVEIGQGVTGKGHCRLRDLIPDTTGILIGAIIVLLWNRMRRRPHPA
ncbi:MAG TPA: VanZ family protein [Blastocatellia bacterium]|nr:VanZ family protein [Blastocatellia bacterium]